MIKKRFRCISNNPLLLEKNFSTLEYHETNILELFKMTMDEVLKGYKLLSHPLTSSIRPDITPYKTLLLSPDPGEIDEESVKLLDRAMDYTEKLYALREEPIYRKWGEEAKKDFQLIDYSIIEQALEVVQWSR